MSDPIHQRMAHIGSLKRWRTGLLVLILLIATALRFYRLDAQSFWNDEGNTARLVERPIGLIVEGAAGDIHPPGYYLLLHAWRAVTGESEFALRSFSALCGVLTVAVTAAVGRRAGGWWTAAGAALFVAVHPLSVYYSQEARMYALLGLASALTLWAAGRLVESQKSKVGSRKSEVGSHVLTLTLSIVLGLYTQYAYIFVLVGLNLAFGLYWLTHRPWRWRLLGAWVAAHALAGLAFLPWSPVALGARGWRPPDMDAAQAFQTLSRTLLVGITLPADAGNYAVLVTGGLLLLALLTRPRLHFAKWAALGMALVPPILILALGVYRPAYLKFLIASITPLGIFLALSLNSQRQFAAAPRRWTAFLLLLTLVPAQITSLRHLYTDPAYARDDYRGIAARIAAEGQPGDAILLSAPNQWEVFTYYYRGPLPVYPAPYRPTQTEAATWVDDITGKHERLFVLFWGDAESDPERLIEPYLAQHAYKASDAWISTVRLARYGTSLLPEAPTEPLDVRLGTAIVLDGYASPERVYSPNDVIPLTLFWRAEQVPEQRYKVFVHLVNAGGALVAQTDGEPGGGFALTTQWQPGTQIADRYGVLLPQDVPAGEYTLLVGMYDFAGERLPVTQDGQAVGDALVLVEVRIAAHEW